MNLKLVLEFSGLLGTYIPSQRIYDYTDKIVIPIGASLSNMIENLDDIESLDQDMISISLSGFMHNFTTLVLKQKILIKTQINGTITTTMKDTGFYRMEKKIIFFRD